MASCPGCGSHIERPLKRQLLQRCPHCNLDLSGYEYVRGSYRQGAYFRKIPFHRDHPSRAQMQSREALASVAIQQGRNKTGTTTIEKDGQEKEIPRSAVPLMQLKGRRFKKVRVRVPPPPPPEEQLEDLVEIVS